MAILNKFEKKKKKNKRRWPYIIIFTIGFLVFLYPVVSRTYYRVSANEEVANFDVEKAKLTDEEVKRRLDLAHAFNESLNNNISDDPYVEKKHEEGRAEYARMLEIHEKIGHIQIPTIDLDIPIYAGTTEEVLQKGAGHLEGTSLPVGGNSTHTVITAHSGLPTARLFTDLKNLKKGDRFYIHNLGEILAYQVDQIKVIEPSNFEDLLVVEGHDYATLLTCTPIMINTHRLIVRGHRVPYDAAIDKKIISENRKEFSNKYIFFGLLALILIMLYGIFHYRKIERKARNAIKELKKKTQIEENFFKKNRED